MDECAITTTTTMKHLNQRNPSIDHSQHAHLSRMASQPQHNSSALHHLENSVKTPIVAKTEIVIEHSAHIHRQVKTSPEPSQETQWRAVMTKLKQNY